MTPIDVKIEVIVFDNNNEDQHVCEVRVNTHSRYQYVFMGIDSAAHCHNCSGCRADQRKARIARRVSSFLEALATQSITLIVLPLRAFR